MIIVIPKEIKVKESACTPGSEAGSALKGHRPKAQGSTEPWVDVSESASSEAQLRTSQGGA